MNDQETYDRTRDTTTGPNELGPERGYTTTDPAPLPMRNGRRNGLGIVLVLTGLLLLAFQVFGNGLSFGGGGNLALVDQTLAGNKIELHTIASNVEVRTWNQDTIRIEADQRGGSRGDYTVNVIKDGDTVRVEEASGSWFCWFCSRSLSYRISVPSTGQADIQTTSGDIDVNGLSGAVTLNSVSGDIQAQDLAGGLTVGSTSGEIQLDAIGGALNVSTISGDVRLENGQATAATVKTTSGDIRLNGVAGALNLTSTSGDINVDDARDAQLAITTSSGDVDYTGSLARAGTNQLNSLSGDVQLELPENSTFQLNASTVSGDLSNQFALREQQADSRSLSGAAGDGSATLTIQTTSGEIQLDQS